MSSLTRLALYRWLERILLLLLVGWVGVLSIWFGQGRLSNGEAVGGVAVTVVLLLVLIYIQRNISEWLFTNLSQANFSQDSALDVLYDNSPVAYLTINNTGQVIDFNAAAVKLLREQVDTIQNSNFYKTFVDDDENDVNILMSKIEAGVVINDLEIPLKTKSEEVIWVIMSIFPYRNSSQRIVSLFDITDQKRVDTAKSEFVALATHQLRTPIAAIRWNVELLRKNLLEVINPDRDRYLTKIERNVLRMIALINDFLSVSKLEMGTFASNPETIQLQNFYNAILDEYAEKIAEKNVQVVRNEVPPDAQIKTDSRLLHIIVSNLVSNAVKYLNPNGTLTLSFLKQNDVLELVVADNGIGIPAGEVEKLFAKFYRASNAQSHQTEGTGLGLYIVKQSVELLGGTINLETAENQGAKFMVRLPVVE